jgi:tetratricopeptide (TPR) repeat protein
LNSRDFVRRALAVFARLVNERLGEQPSRLELAHGEFVKPHRMPHMSRTHQSTASRAAMRSSLSEVANYLKATEADPTNSDAWYYLAMAFEDTGDYKKSINAYQKALQLDAKKKDALHDLALLYLATGQKASASLLASKLMSLDPGLARKLKLLVERQR